MITTRTFIDELRSAIPTVLSSMADFYGGPEEFRRDGLLDAIREIRYVQTMPQLDPSHYGSDTMASGYVERFMLNNTTAKHRKRVLKDLIKVEANSLTTWVQAVAAAEDEASALDANTSMRRSLLRLQTLRRMLEAQHLRSNPFFLKETAHAQ